MQQMRSGTTGNVADSEFQKATDDFLREAELLKTLDHPNVVHLLGVSMDDPDNIDDEIGGVSRVAQLLTTAATHLAFGTA